MASTQRRLTLTLGAYVFAVGLVLHTGDHLRRGTDVITDHVLVGGYIVAAVSVVTIGLILADHRLASITAAVGGFAVAVGVSAAHLLPTWSAFSDSLPDQGLDAFTWFAVLVEIGGALLVGALGLRELIRSPVEEAA
jgi:hypothetical protein